MGSDVDSNAAAQSTQNNNPSAGLATHVKPGRLVSLDALRGFNMFMIIGGATLIIKASQLNDWRWLDWLAAQ